MEYGNWLIKKKITLRSNRNIKLVLCFNKKALVIHPWHDDAIVPPLNVFFEPNIRNLIGIVNELLCLKSIFCCCFIFQFLRCLMITFFLSFSRAKVLFMFLKTKCRKIDIFNSGKKLFLLI